MAYELPAVRIFQLTRQLVPPTARRASACLLGGNAQIYRYDVATEKALCLLSEYNHVGTLIDGDWKNCYAWPNKPVGSTLDPTYTSVRIDKALLRYFRDTSHTMTRVGTNKLRHPTKNFATNGAYPHAADFLDRGVKVGDLVAITATVDAEEHTLFTYVKGFEGEVIAASIGAATANTANQATVVASVSVSAGAGNTGDADVDSTTNGYSGYATGRVSETYTVEVIQGSTGGDLTTAILRITSASGLDDVAEQVPAASGYPTDIGARGLQATFADNAGDFALGDTWTITVVEAWTKTVPTASGTYIGDRDRTYLVEVVTGGISDAEPSDDPWITVRATDGSDFSGPTRVPTAANTAVAAGAYGALIAFNTAKLRLGDRFTFTVTAATTGAYKTLVLAHSLADELPEDDDTIDLEISLYIRSDVTLPEKSVVSDGDYNWTQTDDEICLFADAQVYESSWTDDGELQPLPIIKEPLATGYNRVYVPYKVWLAADTSLRSLADAADLDAALAGPTIPDNPLKYGLSLALQNNNGYPVYYCVIANPANLDSWADALNTIESKQTTYGITPLTYDAAVLALCKAHVDTQSNPENKRYRSLWAGLEPIRTQVVVSTAASSDGGVVLATTEDNPSVSGTQHTLLRVTSGNANLIELGARPRDVVRIRYATDAWGAVTYDSLVIEEVLTEDTLLLSSGTVSAESVPIKIEIWRSLTKTEQADALAEVAAAYDDWRVQAVFADQIGVGGIAVANYFTAGAIAAMVGGIFQHQGLTNYSLSGFARLSDAGVFSEDQRNSMAESGVWLVVADETGRVYNRHGLTTAQAATLVEREEVMRRNFDLVCAAFDASWQGQVGVSNATQSKLSALRVQFESTKESLRTEIADLGPYLEDATITDLRISPVFKDRIVLNATLELPAPFNNLDAYFLV